MNEFWETTFIDKQMMWGAEPSRAAMAASAYFAERGITQVLIPGVGYGRNARPFLAQGMSVTGIEISAEAIQLAREKLGLKFPIHHGSVVEMPFDSRLYDGVFSFALLHLLDAQQRAQFLRACHAQLAPGGHLFVTVVSKRSSQYGRGVRVGPDRYETHPGVKLYYYDADSVQREFGPWGLIEFAEVEEPGPGGSMPFFNVVCRKPPAASPHES